MTLFHFGFVGIFPIEKEKELIISFQSATLYTTKDSLFFSRTKSGSTSTNIPKKDETGRFLNCNQRNLFPNQYILSSSNNLLLHTMNECFNSFMSTKDKKSSPLFSE